MPPRRPARPGAPARRRPREAPSGARRPHGGRAGVRRPSAWQLGAANDARDHPGAHRTAASRIPAILEDSRCFRNIVQRRFLMPIGDWPVDPERRELGRRYWGCVELYARSMRAVLGEGPLATRADELVDNYISEISSVTGLVSTCYTVWARRA